MPKVIRAIFGRIHDHPKLIHRIEGHIKPSQWHREEVGYYVMGTDNYQYLKDLSTKDVRLCLDADYACSADVSGYYNKIWLINKAMEDHDEIFYVDYDCGIAKDINDHMWELLRQKEGRFNGVIQCPIVRYRRPAIRDVLNLRGRQKQRYHVCCCCIYCCDKQWIENWLADYDELIGIYRKRGTWCGDLSDEIAFMYMIDKRFGLMGEQEMIDAFEPLVVKTVQSSALTLNMPKDVYWGHK